MKISESIVSAALYDEIRVWANRSCQAVGSVSLPPLPTDNSLLHSAVWFNFGLDAGKNLMPSVAYAAGKAALPLWLATNAQKYYQKHYDRQMSDAYAMLNKPYSHFNSQIINGITQAERDFPITPYFRQIKSTILELFQAEQRENEEKWKRAIRNLVAESGVIVTDYHKIKSQVKTNLNQVGKKLITLHQGAQRNKLLFVASSVDRLLPNSRAPSAASCRIRFSTGYEAPQGYTRIDPQNMAIMAALYASAYALDTVHIDYEQVMPCLDTTFAKPRQPGKFRVEDKLASSYLGAVNTLAWTYQRQKAGVAD